YLLVPIRTLSLTPMQCQRAFDRKQTVLPTPFGTATHATMERSYRLLEVITWGLQIMGAPFHLVPFSSPTLTYMDLLPEFRSIRSRFVPLQCRQFVATNMSQRSVAL